MYDVMRAVKRARFTNIRRISLSSSGKDETCLLNYIRLLTLSTCDSRSIFR